MDANDKIKEDFKRITGKNPKDDWGTYFAFISATLTLDIHKEVFKNKGSKNTSIFDNSNSPFE